MGIKQLMNIINEKAAKSVRKSRLYHFSGKVIACDANMAIYQFLIALQNSQHHYTLTDESGNPTSHLSGIFYRTIQFMAFGIKPIWVFDGKAPDLKVTELKRRKSVKSVARDKIIAQKNDPSFNEPPLPTPSETKAEEKKNKLKKVAAGLQKSIEKIKNITENGKKVGDLAKNLNNSKKSEKEDVKETEKNGENDGNEEVKEVEQKKKFKKFTIRQWQEIQKKKYKEELEEIEISLRARISDIVGSPIGELLTNDFMCTGESDHEDVGITKELEQIATVLESKGFQNMEEVQKNLKRTVTITSEMLDDVKEMLKLLGVPIVDAPSEAEAQCAELVKSGIAHAVASEDMDALAFGSRILLRGFNTKKEPIIEINLETVLDNLDLTYEEFVDLCILLGCDYSKTIVGVGPAKAYTLIKQFSKIETVLEFIRSTNNKKYEIPEEFHYIEARKLLTRPRVLRGEDLKIEWGEADEDKLKEFLVGTKGFSLNRVENSLGRLHKKQKFAKQPRIDKFFIMPLKRKKENPEPDSSKKSKLT